MKEKLTLFIEKKAYGLKNIYIFNIYIYFKTIHLPSHFKDCLKFHVIHLWMLFVLICVFCFGFFFCFFCFCFCFGFFVLFCFYLICYYCGFCFFVLKKTNPHSRRVSSFFSHRQMHLHILENLSKFTMHCSVSNLFFHYVLFSFQFISS